jgi:hypothetical protein
MGSYLGSVPASKTIAGLQPKDLIGIPWRVAFALQEDGWYLRQDIIWAKPNPMPESVTDRCTRAHEYLFSFQSHIGITSMFTPSQRSARQVLGASAGQSGALSPRPIRMRTLRPSLKNSSSHACLQAFAEVERCSIHSLEAEPRRSLLRRSAEILSALISTRSSRISRERNLAKRFHSF